MIDKSAAEAAHQEVARGEAANAYFSARHFLMDTTDNRRIFEAGFDQAWALLSQLFSASTERLSGQPGPDGSSRAGLRETAKWKRDSELLESVQARRWDVRFSNHLEIAAGEAGPGVQVLASGEQAPDERVIGVEHADDLRGALEQAMAADGELFAGPKPEAFSEREAVADIMCGAVVWRPDASKPTRILFPSYLRKMWSGGEVQTWLDQHQGVEPQPHRKRGYAEFKAYCAQANTQAPVEVTAAGAPVPTVEKPVAYAIYGIGAFGGHYVADVKKWEGPDSLCDDGGLGDYWAGNTPLGPQPDEKSSTN